jgi:hypothetical protein
MFGEDLLNQSFIVNVFNEGTILLKAFQNGIIAGINFQKLSLISILFSYFSIITSL